MERWGRGLRLCAALLTVSGLLATATPAGAAVVTRKLTVQKTIGASYGQGTVTSTATGATTTPISCGPGCTSQVKSYVRYSDITITVAPDQNSTLSSIRTTSGSTCARTGDTCRITSLSLDTVVTVTFAKTPQLSVTKSSTEGGTGTVSATGASGYTPLFQDCAQATCSSKERLSSVITLTATPGANATFSGWSGECTGTGTCTVTMSDARAVTANFRATYALAASKVLVGSGGGGLRLNGVACASSCADAFRSDASVTLLAEPATGSVFSGWSGVAGCTTQAACTFDMGTTARIGPAAIIATFTSLELLTVAIGGADGIDGVSVSSSDGGIDCPGDCSELYPFGTEVSLTAEAPVSAEFTGWTGVAGCGDQATCAVAIDADLKPITATFGGRARLLLVDDLVGAASGAVAVDAEVVTPPVDPQGEPTIELVPTACDPDCWFHPGTVVVLTATADAGSRWGGWDGPCAESDPTAATCTVTLDASSTVTARFIERHTVSVHVVGAEGYGGAVLGIGEGGSCAATCSAEFDHGDTFILTADPANADTSFTWSGDVGDCAPTAAACAVAADADLTITFAKRVLPLAVAFAGTGAGTITGHAATLEGDTVLGPCIEVCVTDVPIHDVVVLSAVPDDGSRFVGWTGCTTTDGDICTVEAEAAMDVTATFAAMSALTVSASDDGGSGTVVLPAGPTMSGSLRCTASTVGCTAAYDTGTTVVISVEPTMDAGSESMAAFDGCLSTTATTCTVALASATTVGVTFIRLAFPLTVTKSIAGTGDGTVRSGDDRIVCGATCSASYEVGSTVTLTAEAATGSRFMGWSGACSGDGACEVTMGDVRSVVAAFASLETLTIARTGQGTGTVTSADGRISCGSTCVVSDYPAGTTIVLTATPDALNVVGGWSLNGCKKNSTCSITLNASTTVTTRFDPPSYALTLKKAGTGAGRVTSTPAGIDCAASCTSATGSFFANAPVTLTATASSTSFFESWGGACSHAGTATTCTIQDNSQAIEVTATFSLPTLTITKQRWATGNGTITAAIPTSSKKVTCGTTCTTVSATYAPGTIVTLTATPVTGSAFSGWGGACEFRGLLTTCSITMDAAAKPVVANFGTPVPIGVSILGDAGSVTIATQYGPVGTCATGTSCQYSVTAGVDVTFTPVPTASTAFDGWDGDDRCAILGTASPCVIPRIVATVSVLVLFRPLP